MFKSYTGTSLVVQGRLRLRASTSGVVRSGLIPGWGTKIPHPAQCGQNKIKFKNLYKSLPPRDTPVLTRLTQLEKVFYGLTFAALDRETQARLILCAMNKEASHRGQQVPEEAKNQVRVTLSAPYVFHIQNVQRKLILHVTTWKKVGVVHFNFSNECVWWGHQRRKHAYVKTLKRIEMHKTKGCFTVEFLIMENRNNSLCFPSTALKRQDINKGNGAYHGSAPSYTTSFPEKCL